MCATAQDLNAMHYFNNCWLNVYNIQCQRLGVRETNTYEIRLVLTSRFRSIAEGI